MKITFIKIQRMYRYVVDVQKRKGRKKNNDKRYERPTAGKRVFFQRFQVSN